MAKTISGAPTEYYNQKPMTKNGDRKWWDHKEMTWQHVWPVYNKMKIHQNFRSLNNLRYARLYNDMELLGLKAGQYTRVANPSTYVKNRVTYNVVKSCIDSATAKIGKTKTRPVYLSENGTFTDQLKAKRLTQFIMGCFQQIGTGGDEDKTMYGLAKQAFRHCGIFGTGVVHFYLDSQGRVKAETNLCEEIIVDETEGMYRKPRQLHRHRYIAREVLLEMYPKFEKEILALPMVNEDSQTLETISDMVETLESWHLPSGPDAKDGRHSLCIRNATLVDERYDDDYFPFLFMRWLPRILGFYGMGLAEELLGIQLEINKLLRNIQISQNLMAVPQIWLDYQSKTIKKKINNEIGGIKYYLGKPPIFTVPQAMSGEIYSHLERLYQRAYEITGISLLSATSQKPAGLNAAVALREYKDTETERFAIQQDMYENFFVEAAGMIKKLCRKSKENGNNPIVQFRDGSSMKTLKFSDVDVPDTKVVVSARPSNLLPKEPAGRIQYVQELIQAGIYDKEEALDLLDFPDTTKINNIKLSSRHVVIHTIEKMVEDNNYISPEPYMNLDFCITYAQSYYSRGKIDEMPEERLELLRRFMSDCERLIQKREQAIQNQQMEAQMAMQQEQMGAEQQQAMLQTGQAAPAPQSELIANAPVA